MNGGGGGAGNGGGGGGTRIILGRSAWHDSKNGTRKDRNCFPKKMERKKQNPTKMGGKKIEPV